jgi:hypothetical protein
MKLLLALVLTLVSALASAQGTWVGECTTAKPCIALADPAPEAVSCTLMGLPGGESETPVVMAASITPPLPAGTVVLARTCYWPRLVLVPGSYTIAAKQKDGLGRVSPPGDPFSVTALPPLAPPGALRLVP